MEHKKGGNLYLYTLLVILLLIIVGAFLYFNYFPLLSSPNCYDDCNSLNYQCGEHEICGEVYDCGKCNLGMECSDGQCLDIEFGLERELGDNMFWFFIFIVVIPVLIIIFILIRIWLSHRKHEERGEVVQWSPFKKIVIDKPEKKGLDSFKI